jgi:GT2 family glycosyltransferase
MTNAKVAAVPTPAVSPVPERPRLSVIVVSFNCLHHVERCLASLEPERAELDFEVLLVDNRSDDGTLDVVAERFGWVQAIDAGGNLGFSRGNNLALELAVGEDILLLNPDTEVEPGALRACVEELERHADIGMLGCKLVQPDGRLDHACKRGFPTPSSSLWHFLGLSRARPTSARFAAYTAGHIDPDEAGDVDAVNGAFMLVRRAALEQVGGLDERYWMYMEDLDWCYRFWQQGWRVVYWPGATVMHVKGGSSSKHRSWKANHAFHHGMWMFYDHHYRAQRNPLVTALVWSGIWAKLGVSAARSWWARRQLAPVG